jgi:NADH pyrophosphatase NudC (nudix superfamily)
MSRLIDADALQKEYMYEHDGKRLMLIDVAPTIEERKTGKWIDAVLPNDNGGLPVQVCDQCNTFFPLAYTGGGHRFCPNCGAKMEAET